MQKLLDESHIGMSLETASDAASATAVAEKLVCSAGGLVLDVKVSDKVTAETRSIESERPRWRRRRILDYAFRAKRRAWHWRRERLRAPSAVDIVKKPPEVKPYKRSPITQRELDVLEGLVLGLTNREIADRFGISRRTVEIHRAHIKTKLGARNTADIMRIVLIGDNQDCLREKLQLLSHLGVRDHSSGGLTPER